MRFMPLARSLALRYRHSGESLDDLTQVAALGLINAIDRFDPDREIAFSSYALPTILGEIKRHFRDRTWSVRVPRPLQQLSRRIDLAVVELAETLHRQPSVAEIAATLGTGQEHVLEAMQADGAYRAASLDAPLAGGDAKTATLADSIAVDEPGFDLAEQRATLSALLATVPLRERKVLLLRFEPGLSQAAIGEKVGVSQMHVSRIIRRALQRLRNTADAERHQPVSSQPPRGLSEEQPTLRRL